MSSGGAFAEIPVGTTVRVKTGPYRFVEGVIAIRNDEVRARELLGCGWHSAANGGGECGCRCVMPHEVPGCCSLHPVWLLRSLPGRNVRHRVRGR